MTDEHPEGVGLLAVVVVEEFTAKSPRDAPDGTAQDVLYVGIGRLGGGRLLHFMNFKDLSANRFDTVRSGC